MRFHETFLLSEARLKAATFEREASLERELREKRRSHHLLPRQRLAQLLFVTARRLYPEVTQPEVLTDGQGSTYAGRS